MTNTDFYALVPEACAQMEKSAFLTAAGSHNPMTIGWAQFGFVWGRPVVQVLVRKSRFTYGCMEKAEAFTVSVPAPGAMKEALAYCGSHSGRDVDKPAAAGLTLRPARAGGAEGVDGCALYFECRIVFKQDTDLSTMDPAIRSRYYGANQALGNGDPHTLYYGEVLGAYRA